MATIDEANRKIIFNEAEKTAAWNNAPKLENLAPEAFRLCYLCKFPMDHDLPIEATTKENAVLGWTIDLINAKQWEIVPENLVAIHERCLVNHQKLDQTKALNKVKSLLWKYNE